MNETSFLAATAIMTLLCGVLMAQAIRVLRRLMRQEAALLADKERWESQKSAELIAIMAHPDDAQMWLVGDNGEGAPYRVLNVGRN